MSKTLPENPKCFGNMYPHVFDKGALKPDVPTLSLEANFLSAFNHTDSLPSPNSPHWVWVSLDYATRVEGISVFMASCGENEEPFHGCQKLHC